MNTKIDLVLPYVNGLDPEWQKIYKQYREDIDFTRFDGHDILKYVFRSIEKNIEWIGTIHLLVMQESQIPAWLDRSKVHIVYHKDFIPEEHLPLFNSSSIEMYLWNIPELSENFIYINDDVLFNSTIDVSDHFDENLNPLVTMTSIKYRDERLNTDYAQTFIGSCNMAARGTEYIPWNEENRTLLRPGHGPQAFKVSVLKSIYDEFKVEIEQSISKFREKYNYSQYLFSAYMFFHGFSDLKIPTYKYSGITTKRRKIIMAYVFSRTKELCLNDIELTTIKDKIWLSALLELRFPNKCKYEI